MPRRHNPNPRQRLPRRRRRKSPTINWILWSRRLRSIPDPLLSQTLVASTYPLEIVQLQQWLAKNPNLKDKALADAVKKQPWDPSIQAMAGLPDVVKRLSDDIKWTTDLGNAFLAQQGDVMDAVQTHAQEGEGNGAT